MFNTFKKSSETGPNRVAFVSDLGYLIKRADPEPVGTGEGVLHYLPSRRDSNRHLNLVTSTAVYSNSLNVIIKSGTVHSTNDDDGPHSQHLHHHDIRRLSFFIICPSCYLTYLTSRERNNHVEDLMIRRIEPAMTYRHELARLSSFDIQS
ncbi:hypothetical protein DFQ26_008724 [Actinomortierella ambigua]|nr:hypothetical protein DFQ26_008724 [Actinomortierella ambigua]